MYNCNICDLDFQSTSGLWQHQNIKHKESKKFNCKDCGMQFSQKTHLQTHFDNIHLNIKHKCDQCDKEFTTLTSKTKHVKSVHDQIRYPCNMCNYQATRNDNL